MRTRTLIAFVTACLVVGAGCTKPGAAPGNLPSADAALRDTAGALTARDMSRAPVEQKSSDAQADLDLALADVRAISAKVEAGTISYDAAHNKAEGTLKWTWATQPSAWSYETKAHLVYANGGWKFAYDPSVIQPALTTDAKLGLKRTAAKRGRILGAGGQPLVEDRDVFKVGLDKSKVSDAGQLDASARAIAGLVGINADEYAAEVKGAGGQQFVLAMILRQPAPSQLGDIPGGLAIPDRMMLGPSKGFGQPLLGDVGEATKEIIAKSDGYVAAGDRVGVSGLQRWHDKTLRGSPGIEVALEPRGAAQAERVTRTVVFSVPPADGSDLKTTLDPTWQAKAESVLQGTKTPSAFAVLQASTGRVLALATSPNPKEEMANYGHYPPGSTFKIASSLALLRKGMTPDSTIDCPTKTVVDNRAIENYPGYPAALNGTISLRTALAQSCNTAFVNGSRQLGDGDLPQAAESLGFGKDFDAGFMSFFGSVPPAGSATERAEDAFGQGKVEGSPMAVAAMSASVAAGKTVVPWLIEGTQPKPTGAPLTSAEAEALRSMMGTAVESGTVSPLKGLVTGGKTGTAEFGTGDKLDTHIWLTGFTGNDVAFAAFQHVNADHNEQYGLVRSLLS